MIDIDIVGVGAWSQFFSNWEDFCAGVNTGEWPEKVQLIPELIPPRERRRAPGSVKMAVEVMSQACEVAGMDASRPAVVFSSAMGDMSITDAMCRTLADQPQMVSPTRFHNSVHNAAIGYWSIATNSHQPSTAVAGHDDSAALGLLEAGVQCSGDQTPVLYVCQEGAAPDSLMAIRPSSQELALALLMVPAGETPKPLARLHIDVLQDMNPEGPPNTHTKFPGDFSGNPTALLLPLFEALALAAQGPSGEGFGFELKLNESSMMKLTMDISPGAGE